MIDDALLRAFGFDEETVAPHAQANGHAYHAKCYGCGKVVGTNRRPVGERRAWCSDCRAAKKPAAQRARDFRAARSKIAT